MDSDSALIMVSDFENETEYCVLDSRIEMFTFGEDGSSSGSKKVYTNSTGDPVA